jgi:GntR family transcriptional regulator
VLPFRIEFRSGVPIHEQVVYAAKKAIVSGHLRPGDAFPSVRAISSELKINPNTAHKVITRLIADGLLESRPGVGTVVTERALSTATEKTALLGREIEELVVEARKLGITIDDVLNSVSTHWKRLGRAFDTGPKGGSRR